MRLYPKEGHWKFQGGRGGPKASFLLKGSMKLNWNFEEVAGGGGALRVQTKTPSAVGQYEYFLKQNN